MVKINKMKKDKKDKSLPKKINKVKKSIIDDPLQEIGYSAEPGDLYYLSPPKELTSYPMFIDNPKKVEKSMSSFVSYDLDGTDIPDKLQRRYSDFFSLYEKLVQRWPGLFIPRIPPKKITGNTDPFYIRIRMRLLNRFLLKISEIDYLYKSEETQIFKSNVQEAHSQIDKLPDLGYNVILGKLKEAFPDYNEHFDIITGKAKFRDFELFLTKCLKNLEDFEESVNAAKEKREADKTRYCDFINGLANYEKSNMKNYTDEKQKGLVFFNTSYNTLHEKIFKLKNELVNPYICFSYWLEEEILDIEAMQIAIKKIFQLIDEEDKLKDKLKAVEDDIKKAESGNFGFFSGIFKKKENILADYQKDRMNLEQKVNDISTVIQIVSDNMSKNIETFKAERVKNYYRHLKMFAIMNRESTKVIRELWILIDKALSEICPNAGDDEDFVAKPMSPDDEKFNGAGPFD